MDFEADFLSTVRETIAALQARGVAPELGKADDGASVLGWQVNKTWEKGYRDGPWLMAGIETTLLTGTGEFWYLVEIDRDLQERPWTQGRTTSLRQVRLSTLVGGKGKPFSEMKATLERLPYR